MIIQELQTVLNKDEFAALSSIKGFDKIPPFRRCYLRKNGNYYILYLDDGSKLRFGTGNSMDPDMPECIDMTISTLCSGGCGYCYLGCNPDGKLCDMGHDSLLYALFKHIPSYMELAININDLTMLIGKQQQEFIYFLMYMKDNNVFVNATVNQSHLTGYTYESLLWFRRLNLIRGIGISFKHADNDLIRKVHEIEEYGPSVVIHVIAGIVTIQEMEFLEKMHARVLILGFKEIGRGVDYVDEKGDEVNAKIHDLSLYIEQKLHDNNFNSIAFDGLSIEQLGVKNLMSKDEYAALYAGDEGAYTFYLDMVNKRFGRSSIDPITYPIGDRTIKDMFDYIRVPGLRKED